MKFIPEHIIHSNRQMMFVSNNKIRAEIKASDHGTQSMHNIQ